MHGFGRTALASTLPGCAFVGRYVYVAQSLQVGWWEVGT